MNLWTPSYKSGFAHNAAESAYPNLWNGLVGLWLPVLGRTGLTLRDISGYGNHGTLTNMDPASAWTPRGISLGGEDSGDLIQLDRGIQFANTDDWTLWLQVKDLSHAVEGVFGNLYTAGNYTRVWTDTSGGGRWYNDGNNWLTIANGSFAAGNGSYIFSCAASDCSIYRDGILRDAVGDPGGGDTWTIRRIGSFGDVGVGADVLDATIVGAGVWDRILLPGERQQLYVDPPAMVRRRAKVFPAAVAAAGGTTNPFALGAVNLLQGKLGA
jgi:hypothetical protein